MTLSDRFVSYFRKLCIALLLVGAVCYVAFSIHWSWMWDAQVMHYIVLLLQHGKVPYKDIYDINLPGCYLTERWAMAVFGGSDLGWRLYEFTLLGVMTLAMIVIAESYDWLAGLFAGVMYSLHIGSLGPLVATEREEVMTVLITVGYALVFVAVRKSRPWLMLPASLAMGIAVLIKPTMLPLVLGLLTLSIFVLARRGTRPVPYLAYASAGLAIAFAILLDFLLPHHALDPFLFILRMVIPYYASLAHPSPWALVRDSLTRAFLVYLPVAVLLAVTRRTPANWEIWAVRAAFIFGGISYFVQGKGYEYHRIAYMCFGLLWAGIEFTLAMKDHGWRRFAGVGTMAFGVFLMAPRDARYMANRRSPDNAGVVALEQDLTRLGGDKLQGRIQCFDQVNGCYSALYRLGLMESTGFTGDLQFFGPDDGKVVPYYRKVLLDDFRANPPLVIVMADEWFQADAPSFDKLNTWPEFRDYLNSVYRLEVTRGPYMLNGPTHYRIYVLKRGEE